MSLKSSRRNFKILRARLEQETADNHFLDKGSQTFSVVPTTVECSNSISPYHSLGTEFLTSSSVSQSVSQSDNTLDIQQNFTTTVPLVHTGIKDLFKLKFHRNQLSAWFSLWNLIIHLRNILIFKISLIVRIVWQPSQPVQYPCLSEWSGSLRTQ